MSSNFILWKLGATFLNAEEVATKFSHLSKLHHHLTIKDEEFDSVIWRPICNTSYHLTAPVVTPAPAKEKDSDNLVDSTVAPAKVDEKKDKLADDILGKYHRAFKIFHHFRFYLLSSIFGNQRTIEYERGDGSSGGGEMVTVRKSMLSFYLMMIKNMFICNSLMDDSIVIDDEKKEKSEKENSGPKKPTIFGWKLNPSTFLKMSTLLDKLSSHFTDKKIVDKEIVNEEITEKSERKDKVFWHAVNLKPALKKNNKEKKKNQNNWEKASFLLTIPSIGQYNLKFTINNFVGECDSYSDPYSVKRDVLNPPRNGKSCSIKFYFFSSDSSESVMIEDSEEYELLLVQQASCLVAKCHLVKPTSIIKKLKKSGKFFDENNCWKKGIRLLVKTW